MSDNQETEHPKSENSFEQSIREAQLIGNNPDALLYDALIKMNDTKAEIVTKFLSDKIQKTEITASERKIIPLMNLLANTPFPSIIKNCKNKKEIEKTLAEFEVPFLQNFLAAYMRLGIPVKRQGRKEEVKALQSYLMGDGLEIKNNAHGGFK